MELLGKIKRQDRTAGGTEIDLILSGKTKQNLISKICENTGYTD